MEKVIFNFWLHTVRRREGGLAMPPLQGYMGGHCPPPLLDTNQLYVWKLFESELMTVFLSLKKNDARKRAGFFCDLILKTKRKFVT